MKPTPPPLTVRLRPRNVCRKHLTWQCDLPDPSRAATLPEALVQLGLSDTSQFAFVRELCTAQEDTIVIVPKTGRVEIRLSYLTPPEDRPARAARVSALIERALG